MSPNSNRAPTVIGLILTPSSRCAFVASSASFAWRTFFPQRVLTKVVRPEENKSMVEKLRASIHPHTSTRSATDHQAKLDTLLDILLSADLNL